MIVENKKTKARHEIPEEYWQLLKELGFAKNFNIVQRGPAQPMQPSQSREIPKEIVELGELRLAGQVIPKPTSKPSDQAQGNMKGQGKMKITKPKKRQ